MAQPASGRTDQQTAELPAERRADLVPQLAEQLLDRPFEELQGHVSREAVGHDHIRGADQEVAALDVAAEPEPVVVAEEPVRLESQLASLLVLLADRKEADLGVDDAEQLAAEDRAHMGELEQVLRPRVRVRAGVEQHRGAAAGRERDGDRGPCDAGEAAEVEEAGGEHRPGVAGGDYGVRPPIGHRPDGGDEARVGLRPHRVGRLVGHRDDLRRLDERQPFRVEAGRAEERHVDPVRGRVERTEDHRIGCVVPAERVERDCRQVTGRSGAAARSRGPCRCRRSGRRGALASAVRTAGKC